MAEWDQGVVQRILDGEAGAYASFVDRYQDPIFHSVLKLLRDPDNARDVTQQAFLAAYEHLDRFDPACRFFSWIYRIARNLALNQLRRDRRRVPLDDRDWPSRQPSPEQQVLDREASDLLRRGLRVLPWDYREVIVLHHLLDLPCARIAGILGLPETTVKSRLFTSRRLLRRQMERIGYVRGESPCARRRRRRAPAP